MHREKQDGRFRAEFTYLLGGLKPGAVGHAEVENDKVGVHLAHLSNSFIAVGSFGTRFEIAARLQDLAKAFAYRFVIVGYEDSHRSILSPVAQVTIGCLW